MPPVVSPRRRIVTVPLWRINPIIVEEANICQLVNLLLSNLGRLTFSEESVLSLLPARPITEVSVVSGDIQRSMLSLVLFQSLLCKRLSQSLDDGTSETRKCTEDLTSKRSSHGTTARCWILHWNPISFNLSILIRLSCELSFLPNFLYSSRCFATHLLSLLYPPVVGAFVCPVFSRKSTNS